MARRRARPGCPRRVRRRRRGRVRAVLTGDHRAGNHHADVEHHHTTTTTVPPTTPTTLAPTTTRPPLPVPIAPPVEDGSTDPVVVVGQIDIPRLGLSRTMYEGIRLSTFDRGPGHWPGSALPGELGNAVVAGHRVSGNQDFREIDQLTAGDKVVFTTDAGRHVYRVKSTEIVSPDALWVVDQTYAKTATLFACHPPGSVAQRIVVHLELA